LFQSMAKNARRWGSKSSDDSGALLDLLGLLQVFFCVLVFVVASWLHGSLPEVQK
jgi:hypothetical protein